MRSWQFLLRLVVLVNQLCNGVLLQGNLRSVDDVFAPAIRQGHFFMQKDQSDRVLHLQYFRKPNPNIAA